MVGGFLHNSVGIYNKDPQFRNSVCSFPSSENVLTSRMEVVLKSWKERMVNCVWRAFSLQGRETLKKPSHQELHREILLLWRCNIVFVLSFILNTCREIFKRVRMK